MNAKKTIIVIMGGHSALNASFPLSKALIQKGYRVIYLRDKHTRKYVEAQGFEFHHFDWSEFQKNEPDIKEKSTWLKRYLFEIRKSQLSYDYLYKVGANWLEEIKPNLVLLDPKLPEFSIPFLSKKIPIIHLNPNFSTFRSKVPPVFSDFRPSGSFKEALRIRIFWLKLFIFQYQRELVKHLTIAIAVGEIKPNTFFKRIKSLGAKMQRTEYGLNLIVPEIVLGPSALDFPEAVSALKRVYAGVCVDLSRKSNTFENITIDDRPLILCALGTASIYYNAHKLYNALFKCMSNLADYQLVLQSEGLSADMMSRCPENVRIFKNIPQLEILKRAKVFITHGGFSSFREAAFLGIPMIVCPGWHDQFGNAARIEYHNLGFKFNMNMITPSELMSLIKKGLNNPAVAHSVREMSFRLKGSVELENALKLIDLHL